MAEEQQDKFTLPIAGVATLLALMGAVFFYQSPLKTSRPIDQEAEKKAASQERIQSRLWQDPFEAVQTHQLRELEHQKAEKAYEKNPKNLATPSFEDLIKAVRKAGASASFHILPIFVDGSPYANGVESRLKDRYALVSALGAAGYMPESGEYIRYFLWSESKVGTKIIIPAERFIPQAEIRKQQRDVQDVLILWLRDQDFSESEPLMLMNELVGHLKEGIQLTEPRFYQAQYLKAFGPNTKESPLWCGYELPAKRALNQNFNDLKDVVNSYWPSIDNNLVFGCLANLSNNKLSKNSYTILGPRYSGTLNAMLKELPGYENECGDENNSDESSRKTKKNFRHLQQATFYSYWPTTDDTFIYDCLLNSKQKPKRSVEGLFRSEGIAFIRTILSEAFLAEQLIKELTRRDIDILSEKTDEDKECRPTVALISEWDTIYGRALPHTFAAMAEIMAKDELGEEIKREQLDKNIDILRRDKWPDRIVRYSYLAGLDGELPPKKNSQEMNETKSRNRSEDSRREQRDMEKAAEGRDQLDYLQRLVIELKLKEERFNDELEDCKGNSKRWWMKLLERRKSFKAIGVLGSDVYDKLLILQALRKEFPQTIFFTTDLDARLLHPENRQWTRNLIVASSFGLQLHPDLQKGIPPFRDSSQTALFYSMFKALRYLEEHTDEQGKYLELVGQESNCSDTAVSWEKKKCFSAEIKPKVFEIGRSAAIDISADPEAREGEFKSIHAARPDLDEGEVAAPVRVETVIWVSIAVVFLGIIAMLTVSDIEMFVIKNPLKNPLKNTLKNPFTPKVYFLVSVPIILGILDLSARKWDGVEGEPYILTQGVSIWPAVALQLLAIGLCIRLYFYARDNLLKKQDAKVSKKFDLPGPGTTAEVKVGQDFWDLCFSIPHWYEIKSEVNNKTRNKANVHVDRLWKEYRELRGPKYSLWRIGAQFIFIFFLAGLLWLKIGFLPAPCRGAACFFIYDSLTFFSSVLLILWMLYVIDTSRLCRRFIKILCEKKFPWPSASKRINNESHFLAVDRLYLNELACINLIGEWTAVVSRLLYFPFIILFLLTIARYNYIDNFAWTIWLILIYSFIAIYAAGVVIALRVTAEKARKRAIEQLEKKLSADFSPHLSRSLSREEQKRQIDQVIQKIKNNQEGAFMPFAKYPVLGALALPAGGTGLLYLIDYLVQSF